MFEDLKEELSIIHFNKEKEEKKLAMVEIHNLVDEYKENLYGIIHDMEEFELNALDIYKEKFNEQNTD